MERVLVRGVVVQELLVERTIEQMAAPETDDEVDVSARNVERHVRSHLGVDQDGKLREREDVVVVG